MQVDTVIQIEQSLIRTTTKLWASYKHSHDCNCMYIPYI